ncbi:MAG TPA: carboxypeptidase-like regulatory domain-containing protein [Bryobacteraceae bacterium]|nr:carboxypeptidase-like regulatory domain-containing protein [Bryobacteraceae bacterium]
MPHVMRLLITVVLFSVPLIRLSACSCIGPGTPCSAAGSSAAVFTGRVLDITDPVFPVLAGNASPALAKRSSVPAERAGDYNARDTVARLPRILRVVRIQVADVLSGVDPAEKQIEIVTGQGGGDCGYGFQVGVEYVVYAYKNAEGRLETGICTRTRTLAQAAEDLDYLRVMSTAPETSQIRVLTGLPGSPGKPGVTIIAEGGGSRYLSLTNAAGDALFTGLTPGDYSIHAEQDGDQPDDPKVQLHAKGCRDVTLFRTLRITGRLMTRGGLPAARVGVELRSTADKPADGAVTDVDGHYTIRLVRPGQYFLGVNLNHTATRDTPYQRWFYPGTEDPASAARIEFSGRPEARTYDFTLPDRLPERAVEGVVLTKDGQPRPRAVVTVFDSSKMSVAQAIADQEGRFALNVFAGIPYRLIAVWPGTTPDTAVSAVPLTISPDSSPLSLRLMLTQAGNLYFEEQRRAPGAGQ